MKFRARRISSVSPRGQQARNDAKAGSERDGFTDLVRGQDIEQIGYLVEDEGAVLDHLARPREACVHERLEQEERAAEANRLCSTALSAPRSSTVRRPCTAPCLA